MPRISEWSCQIRFFLATRIVIACAAALLLGTVVDRLALLLALSLGVGSSVSNALFLLVALLGFFIALPALLFVLHSSANPGCPPLWQLFFTAFLAIWLAALWISAEFGHVAPHLLTVISAHAFMIYGMPAALLFWLSARDPPRAHRPGEATTDAVAPLALATLPVTVLAWEGFSRGTLLLSVLGQ